MVQVVIASQAAVCLCGLWPTGVKRRSEALKNEDRGVGWGGGECVQGKRKKATASPLSGVEVWCTPDAVPLPVRVAGRL